MTGVVALLMATATCGDAIAAEQLPATPHQAEAIDGVERERVQRPDTAKRMPVTEHQQDVLREFEEADTNRDGNLTKEEYAAYMERRAAVMYNASLQKPETPGVETAGPRDRHAAEGGDKPLPATDPTVTN
tara:strand:- start:10976 stop:11368 length:393 start_codon:yes stop_codon:yes gene_type:complete